jgi:hypothetical protein
MRIGPHLGPLLLLGVGSLQILGYLARWPGLRGVGFATAASPLPLVFSTYEGAETFATDFEITVTTPAGQSVSWKLTPELYGRLAGPYNRRNAYGVIFSHGPMFTDPGMIALRQRVLRYGFSDGGPLAREFGLPAGIDRVRILVTARTGGRQAWTMDLRCGP